MVYINISKHWRDKLKISPSQSADLKCEEAKSFVNSYCDYDTLSKHLSEFNRS